MILIKLYVLKNLLSLLLLRVKNADLKINTISWLEKYFESYKETPD